MLSEQLMILECCGSNVTSLLPEKIKQKNVSYVQKLLNAIFLLAALAITKIPGNSKLDCPEVRGNHPADIFTGVAFLKGTNGSQTAVMVKSDIFQNDKL